MALFNDAVRLPLQSLISLTTVGCRSLIQPGLFKPATLASPPPQNHRLPFSLSPSHLVKQQFEGRIDHPWRSITPSLRCVLAPPPSPRLHAASAVLPPSSPPHRPPPPKPASSPSAPSPPPFSNSSALWVRVRWCLFLLCILEKEMRDGLLATAEYMSLPASQYSVLDAERIERIDDKTFRCYVYRLKFFSFEVCPVLVVRVDEEPNGCCIRLLSCKVLDDSLSLFFYFFFLSLFVFDLDRGFESVTVAGGFAVGGSAEREIFRYGPICSYNIFIFLIF